MYLPMGGGGILCHVMVNGLKLSKPSSVQHTVMTISPVYVCIVIEGQGQHSLYSDLL